MKIYQALSLAALAFVITSCAAPEQPKDASEAVFKAPDKIENQQAVQELHGDILRNDF